jgi:hypothetical protein
MTEPNLELTDRVLAQGKALVRAIVALEAIEPSDWFERAIAGLLLYNCWALHERFWQWLVASCARYVCRLRVDGRTPIPMK